METIDDAKSKVEYSITVKKHRFKKIRMFNIHIFCPYCKNENIYEYVVKKKPNRIGEDYRLWYAMDGKVYKVLPTTKIEKILWEIHK